MVKYDSKTGIIDNNKNLSILYPNPTNNNVNIKAICELPSINYNIIDAFGNLILSSSAINSNNEIKIDFSNYSNGIYFVNLNCGKSIKTYKVIKD